VRSSHHKSHISSIFVSIVSSYQVAAEKAKAEAEKDLDPWFSEAEAEDNTVRPKPRCP
jgi:uncharacterized protein YccT (UPF0319 family)